MGAGKGKGKGKVKVKGNSEMRGFFASFRMTTKTGNRQLQLLPRQQLQS